MNSTNKLTRRNVLLVFAGAAAVGTLASLTMGDPAMRVGWVALMVVVWLCVLGLVVWRPPGGRR